MDQEEATEVAEKSDRPERGFWGLIGLQFQGAFSDNVFKQILILLVMARYSTDEGLAGRWLAIIGAIFTLPYLFFAGWAGAFSDRFSKRHIVLATKVAEVVIMAIGGIALFFYTGVEDPTNLAFFCAIGVLFLMATQSTFFSPSKYGILPEILPTIRLTWGNGIIEMTTYGAIILGVVGGNLLYGGFDGTHLERVSLVLVGLAFLGMASGWFIPRVKAARPELKVRTNQIPELWGNMKIIMESRVLTLTVLGISYFWFLGALVLLNAPIWGQHYLGLSVPQAGMVIAVMAIGIGAGSMTVGLLSRRGIEIGFVPLGGLGITLFALPLALAHPGVAADGATTVASTPMLITMLTSLALMGASAGFYSVPLNALLQREAPAQSRGGVIAAMNFVNFTGILFSSLLFWLLIDVFGFTSANIFAIISLVTLGATIYLVTLLPEALLGLVAVTLTRFVYRTHLSGAENIPKKGPALLVSNHVSMVDALLIMSISPRPVRFIVWQKLFDHPILGYFLKIMKAIPVSSDQRPRALLKSLSMAADALNDGELVCIFAEGQITRTGVTLPFRRGFKQILTKAPAPVVPIYLHGVWGSIFSFERQKFIWKWPRQFPYYIQISVGRPLPHDVSTHDMRQSVMALSAESALAKKDLVKPLHHTFVRNARRHPRQFSMADSMTPAQKFGTVLLRSVVLARRLRKTWGKQKIVGVFLPPSVGAVFVNIAAALSGRTVVNLNYTTGRDVLEHCIQQCGLETVITSKLFLSRLKMDPPPGAIYIDDFRQKPKITEIVGAVVAGFLFPVRMLESYCGAVEHPTADSVATIIFSSGSTGVPKGIMLSHFNIASNVESVDQAISLWPDDRVIGFLPFFHSFGYTVTLWAVLNIGFGAIYHNNPLEAKVVGDLVAEHGVTVMIATPTFLQHYIRRVSSRKFGSLEFVLTGAEKLPDRVARAFEERFGMTVYEGYGTSECAPVVALNVDDYRSKGFHQIGHKRGSVGHPLPGVVVRVTDPDTRKLLGEGESGMIEVRGANIMQGYLAMEEKTAEVIKDGWYITGDIGHLDEDGFLHITDRLSRFSKIGGEMAPHLKIEDEIHKILDALDDQVVVVTSVPDERKGEALVVLHTLEEEEIEGMASRLAEAGLPNLWIPSSTKYFRVDEIPILGTGKLDLAEIRRVAIDRVEGGHAREPAPEGTSEAAKEGTIEAAKEGVIETTEDAETEIGSQSAPVPKDSTDPLDRPISPEEISPGFLKPEDLS